MAVDRSLVTQFIQALGNSPTGPGKQGTVRGATPAWRLAELDTIG